jgi:hypothetical protein
MTKCEFLNEKNARNKIKNLVCRLSSKMERTEERINELEDRTIEISQYD